MIFLLNSSQEINIYRSHQLFVIAVVIDVDDDDDADEIKLLNIQKNRLIKRVQSLYFSISSVFHSSSSSHFLYLLFDIVFLYYTRK